MNGTSTTSRASRRRSSPPSPAIRPPRATDCSFAGPGGRHYVPWTMSVLETAPLGPMWPTLDPFLFCVHHDDAYPAANERFGPAASLAGRNIGADFGGRDGWNMYHGEVVPGFPQHPHRGFETLTFVRRGLIDHS